MATIALDATYAVDPEPTGVATYARGLIGGLAALDRRHLFLLCYRLSRFKQRREFLRPPGERPGGPRFSVRLFQQPFTFWLPWQAPLFHSLNQRPPAFRFPREVVTVFDLFTLTEAGYSSADFSRKFSRMIVEAVRRAARIITLSKHTADQIVERCGVRRELIRVIPAAVDAPGRKPGPEDRAREREAVVGAGNEMILSVGAVQVRKNTLGAVRALSTMPPRYKLVLAGANGHGSEAVGDGIRELGLESRVVRLGYVPAARLPALYEAASALLFPSFGEGFGFPVLEAMSHGLPVVTSNASSLPELGGDAALYADPRQPDEIARQVRRAVEDASLRETLIARGYERARRFTWRAAAAATCDVYEEVLAG